jgi:uncharacterized protein
MSLAALVDPLAIILLLGLGLWFPWSAVREFRSLVRADAQGLPGARVRHYRGILVTEWIAVAVTLGWWFASGRPAEPLRLGFDPVGSQWWAVGIGLAASALLVLQTVVLTRNPDVLARFGRKLGDLAAMVPRTAREQRWFAWLSVTAGICEEILYRGLLLAVLAAVVGTWPAVVATSIVFGVGHLYQGFSGAIKTGVVGLVFALLTVLSGSLLVAVVVHIVLDVTSGRMMRMALASPERPCG